MSRNLCIDHYRSVRKERETIDRDVNADRAEGEDAGDARAVGFGPAFMQKSAGRHGNGHGQERQAREEPSVRALLHLVSTLRRRCRPAGCPAT